MADNSKFDPLALFPARIKDRIYTASPLVNGGITKGATNLQKAIAHIPVGNNFYDGTVRTHEALHAIETPTSAHIMGKIARREPLTMLDQALEDARIHTLANLKGATRKDELDFARYDLNEVTNSPSNARHLKPLKALIVLRAAAILTSRPGPDNDVTAEDVIRLKLAARRIAAGYYRQCMLAVRQIQLGDIPAAEATLLPYFGTAKGGIPGGGSGPAGQPNPPQPQRPRSREDYIVPPPVSDEYTFPGKDKVKSKEDEVKEQGDKAKDVVPPELEVRYDQLQGKLTSDSADMLSGATKGAIGSETTMPVMNVIPLYQHDMIRTTMGEEDDKNVPFGVHIDAKRLAMIPCNPNVKAFVKRAYQNGGTVLIDASGSMQLTPKSLKEVIDVCPAATIAFYNGATGYGNLWVYSHRGYRAHDLSKVDCWLGGNTIDFQALQWLIQQPAPRIFFTDRGFCGKSYTSTHAAFELFDNAVARRKILHATSFEHLQELLRNQ